jgi:hypothetical protein
MIEGLSRIQRCEEYDIYPESHDEDIDWKMVFKSKTPAIVIHHQHRKRFLPFYSILAMMCSFKAPVG